MHFKAFIEKVLVTFSANSVQKIGSTGVLSLYHQPPTRPSANLVCD